MRKISDMGTSTFNDLPVGLDQSICFTCKWSDLFRELSSQALSTTRADGREPVGDALKRREAEPDLEGRREKQDGSQNRKCNDQGLVKRARFIGNFSGIPRHGNQVMPFVAQIDIAFDQTQALVFRSRGITSARAVGPAGNALILQVRQPAIPQRT